MSPSSDSGSRARHVALHLAGGGEVDELAHVLHGADRRVDHRRVLGEELERIELDVALARRREARRRRTGRAARAGRSRAGSRPSAPRTRGWRRRRRAPRARRRAPRSASSASSAPSDFTKSRRSAPMSTPIDAVAERARDLHRVVAETAGGADRSRSGDRAARGASSSFLTAPYAVRPPQASGASWSPRLSGIFTSDRAYTAKYSAKVPMIVLGLGAEARSARSGSTRHAPHQ